MLPGRNTASNLTVPRYVFTFGVVPHNIFVREDSGITSLRDIDGHAFNIHVPASFTHGLNLELLEAANIDLDVPTEVLDKMNETYHGLLVPFEIPANTYKGQDETVRTFGVAQVIFTDEDADEEMIYQFIKNFWENLDSLQDANSSFRGMTPELGAKMYGMQMHPGAKRYFGEAGVL